MLHYLRNACHHHQVADSNDVEDEHAAIVQVFVNAVEETLPGREAEQVIDALIGANDGIKFDVELEARHVGKIQGGSLGQLLTRNSQHARRYIQAAHLVFIR